MVCVNFYPQFLYGFEFTNNNVKPTSKDGLTITKEDQSLQNDETISLFDALSKVLNANSKDENQIQSITSKSNNKSLLDDG